MLRSLDDCGRVGEVVKKDNRYGFRSKGRAWSGIARRGEKCGIVTSERPRADTVV